MSRKLRTDPGADAIWGAYHIMVIEKVYRDMVDATSPIPSERKSAKLNAKYGAVIGISEMGSVAGKDDTYTKIYFRALGTKARKANLSFFGDDQDANTDDITLLLQADFLMMSKVSVTGNADLLETIGISRTYIEETAKQLKKRVENPFDFKISEWLHISTQSEGRITLRKFWPIIPKAAFKVTKIMAR